ncbi:coiled-coil domain-containing protein [Faecalispora anaeroviscerum]|uniref:hypothetical protein n=1 Tax=Faecalispora anaeroviscerum TaxID=2991836 RepID=UPI0024B9D4C2|nr:hypothetical protein [Faecalispora anaeroviscerum]
MKQMYKLMSGLLCAALLLSAVQVPAGAAAPTVTVDEALYVNLDHYGKVSQTNVVKGCNLNGLTSFTDYGSYSGLINMSDNTKPVQNGNSVTWNLPKGSSRFYYQGTLQKNSITLPWTFDVSYKWNGVPTAADKLAGVSGTVEIDIKATPNKNASEYYKNNMLLQLGTAFKMEDTLSVEAPGAQQQSIGDYQFVLFAGLPGEEKEYTIRVGTKKFETIGVVMMMVPGTLDQLKDIKELKEDKDTIKDSLDSINNSTDAVLSSLEGMTGGISQLISGLNSADQTRAYISSNKSSVYQNADGALAGLSKISEQTAAMVPHMREGQQMIQDINADVNALVNTVSGTKGDLSSLSSHVGVLRDDLKDLLDKMDDWEDETDDSRRINTELASDLKNVQTDLGSLPLLNKQLQKYIATLQTETKKLTDTLNYIGSQTPTDATSGAVISISKATGETISSLNNLITALTSMSTYLDKMASHGSSLTGNGADLLSELNDYLDLLEDGQEDTEKALKNSRKIASDLQSMLDACYQAVSDIEILNTTMNHYKEGSVNTLKDLETLTNSLTSGLNSANSFLTSLKSLMQTSGGQLDTAAQKTLSGSISVLQKSLEGLNKTGTIRKASDTIDKAVNKELDKYEKDNNLLNLDSQAKPISFTSSQNGTPQSIQIVLRTEEISVDDDKDKTADLEQESDKGNVLTRIRNIFIKIGQAIQSIFSN